MKRRLVVLTGAGMSAESGISTFRDSGGLWDKYPVEQVATPEGFAANPQLVLEFYNTRRKQLLDVKPNEGHLGLAALEKDFELRIITQNVDNLHERAGSSQVLHLHGELTKVRSTGDESLVYELSPENYEVKWGDKCEKGFQLRPHIVWFGEAVPMFDEAVEVARLADVFVVIGTSLNVYPAAGLINYVPRDIPIYLIDPKEVSTSRKDVFFIRKGASEGVKELRGKLRIEN
ncbi:MAG: NAD-dependent deacylase [Dysgonamonadaceae bacterium]|nr:NAD-dependent deacylase [Dysgonamonadaceae bacterium]